MTAWIVIIAVGLGSFLLRATMFAFVNTKPLPATLDTTLGFVGPAAIAALVATHTFTQAGAIEPAPMAELVAIAAGFVAVKRSGNVMHAFTVGLPVLWLLTWVLG